jgi:hypothetical protein
MLAVEEKGSYRYVLKTYLLWRKNAVIGMCIKHTYCGGKRQL